MKNENLKNLKIEKENIISEKQNLPQNIPESKKKNTVKRKKYNNNLYLYAQIIVAAIFIVTGIMLKSSGGTAYNELKEDYAQFFNSENVYESNFSYSSFLSNISEDIREKYNKFMEAMTHIYGKGSSGDVPTNVSMKKYIPEEKGIRPVNGYISSPFGSRVDPFNKKKKDFHTGMDIAAAKGTFIKSAFGGEIIETGYSDTAGNYIKVKNNEEQQTLYCHTQFVFVNKGDKVLKGQIIATVGNTGLVTGPHLHIEVMYKGNKVNPIYTVE